jgi:hypothetical protein
MKAYAATGAGDDPKFTSYPSSWLENDVFQIERTGSLIDQHGNIIVEPPPPRPSRPQSIEEAADQVRAYGHDRNHPAFCGVCATILVAAICQVPGKIMTDAPAHRTGPRVLCGAGPGHHSPSCSTDLTGAAIMMLSSLFGPLAKKGNDNAALLDACLSMLAPDADDVGETRACGCQSPRAR